MLIRCQKCSTVFPKEEGKCPRCKEPVAVKKPKTGEGNAIPPEDDKTPSPEEYEQLIRDALNSDA